MGDIVGNIFKDSAAPYLLVLLLTGAGWMFNSAIDHAAKLRIIEYRFEDGSDGPVATKTVFLANKSLTGSVNAGNFRMSCVPPAGQPGCLVKLPTIQSQAQYVSAGSIRLAENPTVLDNNSVGFPALLPPRGEAGYRIGVVDKSVPIRLIYNVDYDPVKGTQSDLEILLIEDKPINWHSWRDISIRVQAFVFENYITLLALGIVLLVAVIAFWILVQFILLIFGRSDTQSTGKTKLKLTIEGKTHEVVVEEI